VQRCGAQTPVRAAPHRPESPEDSHVLVERDEWVVHLEDVSDLAQRPARREGIEERLEQAGFRLELVVDRHARHASAAGHGVDREPLGVVVLEEVACCREDALATLLDGAHPFSRIVRPTPGHGLIFVRLVV
jgi:hypothetical protein